MKTTIIEEEKETPDFPALYKGNISGAIVLMYKDRIGVVIKNGDYYEIGYYSEGWGMDSLTKITTPTTIRFEP